MAGGQTEGGGWRASITSLRKSSASFGSSMSWWAKASRCRAEYGGLKLPQVRQLTLLGQENGRLRRAVSDLTLEKLILKKAASRNF